MENHVAEFALVLFNSRQQAHIFHLQTTSFAKHKALGAFYETIADLADSYVEAYQGTHDIVTGYTSMPSFLERETDVLPYFDKLEQYVTTVQDELPQQADLCNIVADVLALIHSTQYKLKRLQ
jgi:hypothetical protein